MVDRATVDPSNDIVTDVDPIDTLRRQEIAARTESEMLDNEPVLVDRWLAAVTALKLAGEQETNLSSQ